MKNIHVLPTDKPSRLWLDSDNKLNLHIIPTTLFMMQNIYITSDEEIGTDEYYFHLKNNEYYNSGRIEENDKDMKFWRKIILTTDKDLIKDGVQAIDDEFLEWFVKNPSCERVETVIEKMFPMYESFPESINKPPFYGNLKYKIIIPKEEPKPMHEQIIEHCGGEEKFKEIAGLKPKQETLEEVAERILNTNEVTDGDMILSDTFSKVVNSMVEIAKWQQEQDKNKFSEEEVIKLLQQYRYDLSSGKTSNIGDTTGLWFEQFKKK